MTITSQIKGQVILIHNERRFPSLPHLDSPRRAGREGPRGQVPVVRGRGQAPLIAVTPLSVLTYAVPPLSDSGEKCGRRALIAICCLTFPVAGSSS